MQKEQFDITGMTCSACSTRVEKSVAKLPGIKEVSVNLLKNSMVASYDESVLDTAGIVQAVEKAGYGAIPKASAQNKSRTTTPAAKPEVSTAQVEYKQMKQRLLLSALFTIPLFYISMGHMMGWPLPSSLLGMENAISFAFTQFLLLIPVVFINFKYYRMGFKTLFHGSPNMDSLIAIGSSAAIVYGIYAIYKIGIGFGHGDMATVHSFMMDLYFESAGMILTLITLGKTLEARAKGKTSDAITKLMNLAPKTATVERDGKELQVPVEEVQLGETLIVKAGESVPVDGIVIEGFSSVDESALTGESIPVEKHIGDKVIGATTSKSGYFKIKRALRSLEDADLIERRRGRITVPNSIFVKVPTAQKCFPAWNDSVPSDGTEMISSTEQKCSTNQRNKNLLKNSHLTRTTDAHLTFGEYQNVFLTAKEYRRLKADFSGLDDLIEQLSAYIQSTGKKYADHAATLRIWAKRQKSEQKQAPGIPDYTFTEGESL